MSFIQTGSAVIYTQQGPMFIECAMRMTPLTTAFPSQSDIERNTIQVAPRRTERTSGFVSQDYSMYVRDDSDIATQKRFGELNSLQSALRAAAVTACRPNAPEYALETSLNDAVSTVASQYPYRIQMVPQSRSGGTGWVVVQKPEWYEHLTEGAGAGGQSGTGPWASGSDLTAAQPP